MPQIKKFKKRKVTPWEQKMLDKGWLVWSDLNEEMLIAKCGACPGIQKKKSGPGFVCRISRGRKYPPVKRTDNGNNHPFCGCDEY